MAAHFFDTVENSVTGKPVANATVKVYLSTAVVSGSVAGGNLAVTGTLATIYSDDGVTTINQATSPLTTDSTGYFEFWTSESSVVMLISYDGEGRRAITDVDLIGSSVNSDIAALGTRMTAAEVITLDATVVAFKGLTGAADKVPYFTGVDTMALADFTAAGRALVDDASASAQLTTLGVSTYIKTLLDDADAATARATLGVGTVSAGGYEAGAPDIPLVADFAWFNQGTSTAADGADCLIMGVQVDDTAHVLDANAPATPFDVYARVETLMMSDAVGSVTTAANAEAGLVLRDSADDEMLVLGYRWRRIAGDEQTFYEVVFERSGSATIADLALSFPCKWLRYNVTSTTVTAYISADGRNWHQVGTETISTFIDTVSKVGVYGRGNSNATTLKAQFHSYSFTAPV